MNTKQRESCNSMTCSRMILSVTMRSTADRPSRNPAFFHRKLTLIFSCIRARITLQRTLKTIPNHIMVRPLSHTVRYQFLRSFTKTFRVQSTGKSAVSQILQNNSRIHGCRVFMDPIFVLWQVMKKCHENNVPTHHLVIDFKSAHARIWIPRKT